jgi:hypothetical protein
VSVKGKGSPVTTCPGGVIIPLDTSLARSVVAAELNAPDLKRPGHANVLKRIQALQGEEADLLLWVGNDGNVVLRSIVVSGLVNNLD